ncbi:MAG TPA: glucose/sorbosone family PQQ-dependent dehydrogenase [Polyangiales bacterium]
MQLPPKFPSPSWKSHARCYGLLFASLITACTAETDASGSGGLDASLMDATLEDTGPEPIDARLLEDAAAADAGDTDARVNSGRFAMRVVTSGLAAPWEVAWGPDAQLWITERTGKRVSRVDPETGAKTVLLALDDAYQASPQDGVLGLVLHPRWSPGREFVYVAYTYDANPSEAVDRRARIARYRYDGATLVEPLVLLEALPASGDHNAGRLAFGPDDALYYAIGDQGKNQLSLKCQAIRAQDVPSQVAVDTHDFSTYQGKVLRIALDGAIPQDNPVIAGVRSHVFTYGHRNAQGLAFGPDGSLFAAEQGPKTDDELNLLLPGRNYGWPYVAGLRDDAAYVYGDWSAASDCAALDYSDYAFPSSVPQYAESSWSADDFTAPLRTFYTVATGYEFMDPACEPSPYICWPTIAPSSLAIYMGTGIPGWTNSLLLTSLKDGAVHRLRLNARGDGVEGDDELWFDTTNRYRDLAIAPDGTTFYIATDATGDTRAPDGKPTQALEHPGAILEFRYLP